MRQSARWAPSIPLHVCWALHTALRSLRDGFGRAQAEAGGRAAAERALSVDRRAMAELAGGAACGCRARLLPTLDALHGTLHHEPPRQGAPAPSEGPVQAPEHDSAVRALNSWVGAGSIGGSLEEVGAGVGAMQAPEGGSVAHVLTSAGARGGSADASCADTLTLPLPHGRTASGTGPSGNSASPAQSVAGGAAQSGGAASCVGGTSGAPKSRAANLGRDVGAAGEGGGTGGACSAVSHSGGEAVRPGYPSPKLTLTASSEGSASEYASAAASPISASARFGLALPSPSAVEVPLSCTSSAPDSPGQRTAAPDWIHACGGLSSAAKGAGGSKPSGSGVRFGSESDPATAASAGVGRDGRPKADAGAAVRAAEARAGEAEAAGARLSAALTAAGQRVKAREEQCRRLQAQLGHAQLRLVRETCVGLFRVWKGHV